MISLQIVRGQSFCSALKWRAKYLGWNWEETSSVRLTTKSNSCAIFRVRDNAKAVYADVGETISNIRLRSHMTFHLFFWISLVSWINQWVWQSSSSTPRKFHFIVSANRIRYTCHSRVELVLLTFTRIHHTHTRPPYPGCSQEYRNMHTIL